MRDLIDFFILTEADNNHKHLRFAPFQFINYTDFFDAEIDF